MLFTDIEGSTRLLNRLGPAYADVLASHRRHPASGVRQGPAAASWAPRATASSSCSGPRPTVSRRPPRGSTTSRPTPGPREWPLRVRMGLHTGHPEPFEDNLVGLDVHLARPRLRDGARRAGRAHDGHRGPGAGPAAARHVLARPRARTGSRTSSDPQRLYQLVVPGLPDRFPPLRSLGAPGSLPVAARPLSWAVRPSSACPQRAAEPRRASARHPDRAGRAAGKTRLLGRGRAGCRGEPRRRRPLRRRWPPRRRTSMAWTAIAESLGRAGDAEAGLLEHLRDRRAAARARQPRAAAGLRRARREPAARRHASGACARHQPASAARRRRAGVPGAAAGPTRPRSADARCRGRCSRRSRCGCSSSRHGSSTPLSR